MNAYEEGGSIVLDVARLDHIWRDGGLDFPDPLLHRWTIDTTYGTVREEQVDDRPAEFPRVPDALVGAASPLRLHDRQRRRGHAGRSRAAPTGSILKYDRASGDRATLDLGRGRMPGEVVFVPAGSAAAEDDGYLMTYVYDAASDSSSFVVFDAATMDPEPVGRVPLPRIPFGFHGSWIPTISGRDS